MGPAVREQALILTASFITNSDTNNYRKHLKHKLCRGLDQLLESAGASWDQGVSSRHVSKLLSSGVPTVVLSMTASPRWPIPFESSSHLLGGYRPPAAAAFLFPSRKSTQFNNWAFLVPTQPLCSLLCLLGDLRVVSAFLLPGCLVMFKRLLCLL